MAVDGISCESVARPMLAETANGSSKVHPYREAEKKPSVITENGEMSAWNPSEQSEMRRSEDAAMLHAAIRSVKYPLSANIQFQCDSVLIPNFTSTAAYPWFNDDKRDRNEILLAWPKDDENPIAARASHESRGGMVFGNSETIEAAPQSSNEKKDATRSALPGWQYLSQLWPLLDSGGHAIDSAKEYAASRANAAVFGNLQQQLSQFGTADVSMGVGSNGTLNSGSANLLVPLYDNKDSFLEFSQVGYLRESGRNTLSLGFGGRRFSRGSMYGINTFFDDDVTGHNARLGIGSELAIDYVRFSVNGYIGITGWHPSIDLSGYDERPANGFDINTEMYLPSLPQLGAKFTYEQYFGESVDLFGTDNRQRNPLAVTVGLNYTPVPAVVIGANYRLGQGGQTDVQATVQLNYRLGVPWSKQFDPRAVGALRTLVGGRYDLVQRNSRIVLDYRKQVTIRLALIQALSGYGGDVVPVPVTVNSTNRIRFIRWLAPGFIGAGGSITGEGTNYDLTLPAYQTGAINTYTVSAVAFDVLGNASPSAQMQVTVMPPVVGTGSSVTIVPSNVLADGHSTATLTVTLRDTAGQPLTGLANSVGVTPSGMGIGGPGLPTISKFTEQAPGIYKATITAGTAVGTLSLTPTLRTLDLGLSPASVTFYVGGGTGPQVQKITISPDPSVTAPLSADGFAAYTFTAWLVDNHGNALAAGTPLGSLGGLNWQSQPAPGSGLVLTPLDTVTGAGGSARAKLTSTVAIGGVQVSAKLGSQSAVNAPQPVSFTPPVTILTNVLIRPANVAAGSVGATDTVTGAPSSFANAWSGLVMDLLDPTQNNAWVANPARVRIVGTPQSSNSNVASVAPATGVITFTGYTGSAVISMETQDLATNQIRYYQANFNIRRGWFIDPINNTTQNTLQPLFLSCESDNFVSPVTADMQLLANQMGRINLENLGILGAASLGQSDYTNYYIGPVGGDRTNISNFRFWSLTTNSQNGGANQISYVLCVR